jgi:hypothetical protein
MSVRWLPSRAAAAAAGGHHVRDRCGGHTELIQAISALNLLLNLFLNSGAESMVQQE